MKMCVHAQPIPPHCYCLRSDLAITFVRQTMFAIGSNSKLFTTLALGTLVESDKSDLTWSCRISDILKDDWKLEDPITEKYANLVDILSHRTGLPGHGHAWLRGHTAADAVRNLKYLRPSAEFRDV